jgi:DNA repair exonuclease SbcCD ATPase subunit
MANPFDLKENYQLAFLELSTKLAELVGQIEELEEKYESEKNQSNRIDSITEILEPIAQESYNAASLLEQLAAEMRNLSSNWKMHVKNRYETLRDMRRHL